MKTRPAHSPRIWQLTVLGMALFLLSACQFLHDNTIGIFASDEVEAPPVQQSFRSEVFAEPDQQRATTTVDVEKLQPAQRSDTGQVEVIWEIPEEAVDAYVIRYGINRESLDKYLRVSTTEIERYEDPDFGFVYRYIIHNVPSDQVIFVAMATVRGDVQSKLSDIFSVAPQKKVETE